MSDRCYITFEIKGDDRSGHRRELRKVDSHLVDRTIGMIDRHSEKLLGIRVRSLVRDCLGKQFHGHLRCEIAGVCSTDAISNHEYSVLRELCKRILVLRALFTEPAVGY